MLETFGFALVALLVVLDPPGTAVIFAAMTPRATREEQRAPPRRGFPGAVGPCFVRSASGETR